jgi:ribosomal protein L31
MSLRQYGVIQKRAYKMKTYQAPFEGIAFSLLKRKRSETEATLAVNTLLNLNSTTGQEKTTTLLDTLATISIDLSSQRHPMYESLQFFEEAVATNHDADCVDSEDDELNIKRKFVRFGGCIKIRDIR